MRQPPRLSGVWPGQTGRNVKECRETLNAADAHHVDFPKFGEGVPLWWCMDIGGVGQGDSELLQAVYTNP